jgi:hypothetical protein
MLRIAFRMADGSEGKQRITPEQREEATRRVVAGETAAALAKEYGCTRAYISLLKAQALDPERFRRKAEAKLSVKLTDRQIARLKEIFDTSTPEENELIPAREKWSLDHGFQLAMRLFGKKPSVRAMKECMGEHIKRRPDEGDPKPKPPKPHHINQLDPELAKDPDFVAYYLSPVCERIAWKEYEFALAEWEKRNPHGERPPPGMDDDPAWEIPAPAKGWHPPPPGQRVGKHAKSKGSPFTKPKRRKRR